jgi:hypothetical protein
MLNSCSAPRGVWGPLTFTAFNTLLTRLLPLPVPSHVPQTSYVPSSKSLIYGHTHVLSLSVGLPIPCTHYTSSHVGERTATYTNGGAAAMTNGICHIK